MLGIILTRDLDRPDVYLVIKLPSDVRHFARRWGETITPQDVAGADTLEELQDALRAAGRIRLSPRPEHPPGVLELWL